MRIVASMRDDSLASVSLYGNGVRYTHMYVWVCVCCVAACCSMLQHVAACCSVLQLSMITTLVQCVTVCCRLLQFGAVRWNVLQRVAACCSVLQLNTIATLVGAVC